MTPSESFMQQALTLARRGEGRTAPNPPVGAVLVRDGQVVGEGFHPAAGQPHAEVFALRQAGEKTRGATLYVTLEPCCHQGKTGPCTEAVIAAGVSEVYVGTVDPNPLVAGKGVSRLQQAGLAVHVGLLEAECRQLLAPFATLITAKRPYVLFKSAITLDGRIATSAGDSRWISCEKSRERVHQLRNRVDGILVGSRTVMADNPRLTTRLDSNGRNAARIVVDSRLQTSPHAEVYNAEASGRRILVTGDYHPVTAYAPYLDLGVEIVRLPLQGDYLAPQEVLTALGKLDLMFLLLEGGGQLGGVMLRAGLVDRVMLFVAPLLLGGDDGLPLLSGQGVKALSEAWRVVEPSVTRIDDDILIEGEVRQCLPA